MPPLETKPRYITRTEEGREITTTSKTTNIIDTIQENSSMPLEKSTNYKSMTSITSSEAVPMTTEITSSKSGDSSTMSTNSNNTSAATNISSSSRGMPRSRLRRRIRSRSAPAGFNRKNHRRRLVEQHFKIDKENMALLPGVPAHDDDLARDLHDFFNLIVLVPIVVLNVLNWDWDKLFYVRNVTEIPFVHAWTGEYFHAFFWTTVAYFFIDLAWVCAIPKCVKSPSTIIQHHLAVFVYLILPYFLPKVRFLMGVLMSVELNTWFLIARRVFNKQGLPSWKLDIPYFMSVRVKLISVFFYISWISIRCVMYPYVLYVLAFPLLAHKNYADVKHAVSCAVLIQAVFCFLNAKWSLQLLNSKIRQWKKNGETKVASGL